MTKAPPYISVMMGFHPSALELIIQTQVGHSASVFQELLFTVQLEENKRVLDVTLHDRTD